MNIIVATSKNMGIGIKNKLPWTLQKELLFFKKKTIGGGNNLILMGKNTWNSLPKKPLLFRDTCVLSTTLKTNLPNTKVVKNKKEFEILVSDSFYSKIWIIGGESIYKQFIDEPYVENIYLTHIQSDFNCDAFFPSIPSEYKLKEVSSTIIENNVIYKHKLFSKDNVIHNHKLLSKDNVKEPKIWNSYFKS